MTAALTQYNGDYCRMSEFLNYVSRPQLGKYLPPFQLVGNWHGWPLTSRLGYLGRKEKKKKRKIPNWCFSPFWLRASFRRSYTRLKHSMLKWFKPGIWKRSDSRRLSRQSLNAKKKKNTDNAIIHTQAQTHCNDNRKQSLIVKQYKLALSHTYTHKRATKMISMKNIGWNTWMSSNKLTKAEMAISKVFIHSHTDTWLSQNQQHHILWCTLHKS